MASNVTTILLLVCFGLVFATGTHALTNYSTKPGQQTLIIHDVSNVDAVQKLRNECGLEDDYALLFVHPHCPCTTATVRNLQRILAVQAQTFDLVSIVFCPDEKSDDWVRSGLIQSLESMGSRIRIDRDAQLARELGVHCSGHLLFYSANGKLKFSGGITPSRGHEGTSRCGAEFKKALNQLPISRVCWPVYGCSLFAEDPQDE